MSRIPPAPTLRRQRLAATLANEKTAMALVGPGADFSYFTGRRPIATERLLALLVYADGRALIVAPLLQAPLYADIDGVDLITWADGEDPVARLAQILRRDAGGVVAVDEAFWSDFLLGLQQRGAGEFISGRGIIDAARTVKQPDDINGLTRAAAAIDKVWAGFCASCGALAGQTEFALRDRLRYLMQQEGFSDISWIDVGAGPNGASSLHHGSEKVIGVGEPVVFDFAGCYAGYYGDICRVAITGSVPPAYQALYDVVLQAQEAAFQQVRPGVTAGAVDQAARDIIAAAGFGEHFTHRTGHGIGLVAHENPYIVSGNAQPLREDMVFSIEPGVYLPGRYGVRIEDILVVTHDGARRLTQSPRRLCVIDSTAEPIHYAY